MNGFHFFRFAHRSHTGRRLEHHHTSFSALLLVALVGGVLLFLSTQRALADPPPVSGNILTTATVPGTPPVTAPTIDVPTTGQSFTATPITVSGTCESGRIVKVFKNGVFGGSTTCSVSGTYSLLVDLFLGSNSLVARNYNLANLSGPDSNIVTVSYNPPAPPPPTPTGGVTPTPAQRQAQQFLITSDTAYRGAFVGSSLSWPVSIVGGSSPYAISWDWGDGTTILVARAVAGPFSLEHTYTKTGTYTITIKGTDSAGSTAYLQVVSIVSGQVAATGNRFIPPLLMIVWPLYGFALILLLAFWLGEQSERHSIERNLKEESAA